MSDVDTVGSLLANIAQSLNDALRVFSLADKRHWGADEDDQFRALEDVLDEAKKDFQAMGPLVNGQFYYESDRRAKSLSELRTLCTKFQLHTQTFKDWARTGGPVNPMWVRDTKRLRKELHRAQCRAARRIFNTEQETSVRCLGAFLVSRQQRQAEPGHQHERRRRRGDPYELPLWQQQQPQPTQQPDGPPSQSHSPSPAAPRPRNSLESLVPTCNEVGSFQRFGERDIAFVCDYCDGFIIWEDLRSMPSARSPPEAVGDTQPNWRAVGTTTGLAPEEKPIVFAPLAIANHAPPHSGEWLARLTCPYCALYTYVDEGVDSEEELRYSPDETMFPSLQAFQEHLEWHHTSLRVPALPASTPKCSVM